MKFLFLSILLFLSGCTAAVCSYAVFEKGLIETCDTGGVRTYKKLECEELWKNCTEEPVEKQAEYDEELDNWLKWKR